MAHYSTHRLLRPRSGALFGLTLCVACASHPPSTPKDQIQLQKQVAKVEPNKESRKAIDRTLMKFKARSVAGRPCDPSSPRMCLPRWRDMMRPPLTSRPSRQEPTRSVQPREKLFWIFDSRFGISYLTPSGKGYSARRTRSFGGPSKLTVLAILFRGIYLYPLTFVGRAGPLTHQWFPRDRPLPGKLRGTVGRRLAVNRRVL